MHIEPGIVTGAKLALSYATGAAAAGCALKLAADTVREQGIASFVVRTVATTALVFFFFELLPHFRVGVSEVHFILGSTLFLLFGAAPAAFGLALGLLLQGLFFVPADLPQFGMNVTTLLVPLFALAISTAYQSGIVVWVAFWALYGSGFGAANLTAIASFAASYALVIAIEPLADLAVLALAKSLRGVTADGVVTPRLHNVA